MAARQSMYSSIAKLPCNPRQKLELHTFSYVWVAAMNIKGDNAPARPMFKPKFRWQAWAYLHKSSHVTLCSWKRGKTSLSSCWTKEKVIIVQIQRLEHNTLAQRTKLYFTFEWEVAIYTPFDEKRKWSYLQGQILSSSKAYRPDFNYEEKTN